MNLDDIDFIHQHDPHGMLAEIDALPAQLQSAWELGQRQAWDVPKQIERILVAGMGGSAIGGDLASAYVADSCRVPIFIHRDYGLPAWARGAQTLVIASSHSGNTEETLEAFEAAGKNGCSRLAICTGGKLKEKAKESGIPTWKFEHVGQPRAAVGFSFGLILAAIARLGLIPDPGEELRQAVEAMRLRHATLKAESPVAQNPAKRMAGQLVGRWVNVYAAEILAPVARRWKGQINELAKAGASFELLPEADHNTLAGAYFPEDLLTRSFHLFLHAPAEAARNTQRLELTRQALMVEGLNTDAYTASGDTSLAQMWTAIQFGDFTAFYLAMAYGVDPWDTTMLETFKAAMKARN